MLTKGLIGIVFPAAIIGIYLILTGNLKHLLRMRLISSTLVLLLIAAPWHIAAAIENPAAGQSRGFLWFYFVNEHFLRYLGKRIPHDYDTVPLLIFWALVFLWLFPWSAFLVQALARVPHRWRQWRSGLNRRQRAMLLYAVWAAVILLFFSFSTRQEYYAVPALPALALLIGGWLQEEADSPADSRLRRAGRIGSGVLAVLGIVVFVAAIFLLAQSTSTPADSDLADLLKKNPNEYALAFGHIFDLTPRALGLFRVPLATFAIALLVGSILNLLYRRRNSAAAANWVLDLMMVAVLFAVHQGLVMFSPILSSKKLADAVEQEYRPGDVIVSYGTYEDASTINFYVRQPIHVVNTRTEGDMYYGSLFPDAPAIFDNDASLARLWTGPRRVFLWVEEDKIPSYIRQSGSYQLARSGGKLILMNRTWAGQALAIPGKEKNVAPQVPSGTGGLIRWQPKRRDSDVSILGRRPTRRSHPGHGFACRATRQHVSPVARLGAVAVGRSGPRHKKQPRHQPRLRVRAGLVSDRALASRLSFWRALSWPPSSQPFWLVLSWLPSSRASGQLS